MVVSRRSRVASLTFAASPLRRCARPDSFQPRRRNSAWTTFVGVQGVRFSQFGRITIFPTPAHLGQQLLSERLVSQAPAAFHRLSIALGILVLAALLQAEGEMGLMKDDHQEIQW